MVRRRVLRFGTGAGITWGSDAAAEWAETELKAARLVALACAYVDVGPVHRLTRWSVVNLVERSAGRPDEPGSLSTTE